MGQPRQRRQDNDTASLIISLSLILTVLITDSLTPLGFAHGILYSPILLLASRSQHGWHLDLCFGIALISIWTGYLLAPLPQYAETLVYVIGNRILSSVSLVAVFILCRLAIHRRQQLLRQQQQLQQAHEITHLGYWRLDSDQRQIELNKLATSILESGAPQLDRAQFINLFSSTSQRILDEALNHCLQHQTPLDLELLLPTKNGLNKWLRIAAQIDPAGTGAVHGTLLDVSSTRTAEIIAEEAENRLRYLADNFPLFIWTALPDGSLDYASSEVTRLTGRDNDFILKNWLSLVAAEDRRPTTERWQHSLQTGEPYAIEFRLRRHDGHFVWHQVKASPTRDADGNIIKWYGSAMDIDAIKQLQQHAETLAQQLENTLQSITDGFFSLDRQLRFRYVNDKAASMLGHARNNLLDQMTWHSCIEQDETFEPAFRRTLRQQTVEEFEAFLPTAGLWLAVKTYPSTDGITVYLRDITRQRDEQEQLKLLRSAIAQLNDIVMITRASPIDHPGPEIIFVNEAFERITGYQRDEVIGQSPRLLQGPKTERAELDRIRQALEAWQPVRARLTDYAKDKRELILELNIVPIVDAHGIPTHWVSVERDITEEVQLQQQLFQSQRMDAIGQLTGGIAHDFNNLLTVISGNSEILLEQLADQPRYQAMVSLIADAAHRGAGLTQNLLAYASKQPLSPQPADLEGLIQNSVPLLRSSLGSDVRLTLELPGNTWSVMIDPVQMESSLLNLAINARAAMPQGGQLTIAVENIHINAQDSALLHTLSAGDYVCVSVSDTGQGIDSKHIDKVFEPFFTTKPFGQGTGLGLSMIYGFVKQSGGHINVHSSPGHGCVFNIYLPRSNLAALPASTNVGHSVPFAKSPSAVILLVEDESMVRRYAKNQLEAAGHRVIAASNAAEALQLFDQHADIDLLFTDMQMPGEMNGLQLASTLRSLSPSLPVLITSGFNKNAFDAEQTEVNDYQTLYKPYSRDALLSTVTETLVSRTGNKG